MGILDNDFETTCNLLDDLLEQRKVISRDISLLHDRKRYLLRLEREIFKPKNFRLTGVIKSKVIHFVARYASNKRSKVQSKPCRYWATWDQFDNEGNFIRAWSCPAYKANPTYPDFIKQSFIQYMVMSDDRIYTSPPTWIKPFISN